MPRSKRRRSWRARAVREFGRARGPGAGVPGRHYWGGLASRVGHSGPRRGDKVYGVLGGLGRQARLRVHRANGQEAHRGSVGRPQQGGCDHSQRAES
eukprot:5012749-Alexandrium_andersonii.AAC.1